MLEVAPTATVNGHEIHETRDPLTFTELQHMVGEYGFAGNTPEERLEALRTVPDESILSFVIDLNRRLQGSEHTLVDVERKNVGGGADSYFFISPEYRYEVFLHAITGIKQSPANINPARAGDVLALANTITHPAADGNGRTSRILGFIFRDSFDDDDAEDTFTQLAKSRERARQQNERLDVHGYIPRTTILLDGVLPATGPPPDLSTPQAASSYIDRVLTEDDPRLYTAPWGQSPRLREEETSNQEGESHTQQRLRKLFASRAVAEETAEDFEKDSSSYAFLFADDQTYEEHITAAAQAQRSQRAVEDKPLPVQPADAARSEVRLRTVLRRADLESGEHDRAAIEIIKQHYLTPHEHLLEADMPAVVELIRTSDDLRYELGRYFLSVIKKAPGNLLTDAVIRNEYKTPQHPGYRGMPKMRSEEYVALLMLSALDGTLNNEYANSQPVEPGAYGATRLGQHRTSAENILRYYFGVEKTT